MSHLEIEPAPAGGGFSNPLVGGGGALVYPSIHSPNFVSGSTGWSINKNGTAEFNSLTVRNGTIISGVFLLYSSAIPAKGNLVVAFAPQAGGTDAVGNVYPQGFNFGVWNASGVLSQHFGIDTNGKLYLADSTGKTRIFLDPSLAAELIYDSSGQSAGHLISSIASAAGTDSAANAFVAGVAAYATITGIFAGTYAVELQDQTQPWGTTVAALTFNNQTNIANLAPAVTAQAHSSAGCNLNLQSGKTLAGSVAATVQVQDSVSSGVTGGLVDAIAGKLQAILPDGNAYRTEHLTLPATATPQTVSSTSATTITGCSAPVGAVKYAFKARVTFSGGSAAGTANFSVSGPANTGAWINAMFIMTTPTAGAGAQNAALGPVNSPTLTTGNNVADIEGEVTFTAAGTIALQVAEGTAGDTVIIQKAHFWLLPI